MKWSLSVQKICHVYWSSGQVLPYMRYLTVTSFMKQNPDWRVILWTSLTPSVKKTWESNHQNYDVNCDDYYDRLLALDGLEKHAIDFSTYGFNNDASEVHKSDFLRLYLLTYWGGLWSDMDIIYFRPMTSLAVNHPCNKDKDTFVCMRDQCNNYNHSGGFLMSVKGRSQYFESLLELCPDIHDAKTYQSIGVDMFNNHFPTFQSVQDYSDNKAVNIDMDAVYAHDALHVKSLLGKVPLFMDNSIAIHWYAGNELWGKFIRETNGGLTNLPDCVISNVIKKASV